MRSTPSFGSGNSRGGGRNLMRCVECGGNAELVSGPTRMLRRGARTLEVPRRFWRCLDGCLSERTGGSLEWVDRKTEAEDAALWERLWKAHYGVPLPKV